MALQAEKRQEARHVLYVCLGEQKIVWLKKVLVMHLEANEHINTYGSMVDTLFIVQINTCS